MPYQDPPGGRPARDVSSCAERMRIDLVDIPATGSTVQGLRIEITDRGQPLATYHAMGSAVVNIMDEESIELLSMLTQSARGRDPWPAFLKAYGSADDEKAGHRIMADLGNLALKRWVVFERRFGASTVRLTAKASGLHRLALSITAALMAEELDDQAEGGPT